MDKLEMIETLEILDLAKPHLVAVRNSISKDIR